MKRRVHAHQVRVEEIDLDQEPITLPDGTVLDEKAAEKLGREVDDRAAARRGRPSLTAPGVHSPRLTVRVDPDVKTTLEEIARRQGRGVSDVVREAIDEYASAHDG